jgi:hypothetical protein
MKYGSVTVSSAASLITRIVESSLPDDLTARVNDAIAALPSGYVVVGLTLAGGGQGPSFVVEIDAGLLADTTGGFQSAPPVVTCFLASESEALLIARLTASPAVSDVFSDTQIAGSSSGTEFMGMVVTGTVAGGDGEAPCLVQSGWDQPTVSTEVEAASGEPFPRDASPDPPPLQVVLPNAVPGNVIEIYWNMTLGNTDPNTNVQFSAVPAISFTASPSFPNDFFAVGNGQAGSRIPPAVGEDQSDVQWDSMAGSAAVTIPDGVDPATVTVWLLYTSSAPLLVGGTNLGGFAPGVAATLRATEFSADCVSQSNGELFPLGG